MNKGYKKILARFTKLLPKKKVGYTPRNVTRDWLNTIFTSVGVGVLLCGVGVYQFYVTREAEMTSVGNTQKPLQTFSKERLNEVLFQYQERTQTFLEMRSVAPEAPDLGVKKEEVIPPEETEVVGEEEVIEDELEVSPLGI